jgi:hypothetical protein
MRYSTYVKLNVAAFLAIMTIFSIAFVSILGGIGVGLAILFWLVGLLGLGLSLAWAHRAVSEFQGMPFPGIWGVLGFDVLPDDAGTSPFGYAQPDTNYAASPGLVEPASASPPAQPAPPIPPTSSSVAMSTHSDAGGPVGPAANGCSECGAVTQGADSRFCRMCGASLGN